MGQVPLEEGVVIGGEATTGPRDGKTVSARGNLPFRMKASTRIGSSQTSRGYPATVLIQVLAALRFQAQVMLSGVSPCHTTSKLRSVTF